MNKSECRMKLKHQLEIEHRLQQVGLFTAAIESHKKALVLLQIYKRHFLEKPFVSDLNGTKRPEHDLPITKDTPQMRGFN